MRCCCVGVAQDRDVVDLRLLKKKKKKSNLDARAQGPAWSGNFLSGRSYRLNKVEGKKAKGLFESRTQVIG